LSSSAAYSGCRNTRNHPHACRTRHKCSEIYPFYFRTGIEKSPGKRAAPCPLKAEYCTKGECERSGAAANEKRTWRKLAAVRVFSQHLSKEAPMSENSGRNFASEQQFYICDSPHVIILRSVPLCQEQITVRSLIPAQFMTLGAYLPGMNPG
jgi:hypothetical protein